MNLFNESQPILPCLTEDRLKSLSKNQLAELSKQIAHVRKAKYPRNHHRKYGSASFAMSLSEVDIFLSAFKPEEWRYKVACVTGFFTGLRVGELLGLKVSDIDFNKRRVLVKSSKKAFSQIDSLPVPERLVNLLLEYVSVYGEEIKECDNFLFFSLVSKSHVSHGRFREKFRQVCNRAGLTEVYGEREGLSPNTPVKCSHGKLYRFHPHSLRHTFCVYLADRDVPPVIAKHFSRLDSLKSLEIYYRPSDERVTNEYARVFENDFKRGVF